MKKIKFLFLLTQIMFVIVLCSYNKPRRLPLQKNTYKYELSVCMIFHNEAAWLKEWIEYHQLVGVQHFYLYNNRSTDHYQDVLHDYVEKGIVTLTEWPYGNSTNYISKAQIPAYRNALREFSHQTKWMAVIDSDEFIVPIFENSILDVLKDFENYGGLAINWQTFGTSNVPNVLPNELMIEKLTWMALPYNPMNTRFKTILRADRADAENCLWGQCNAHRFPYLADYYAVNSHGNPVPGPLETKICLERIQINHYRTRDEEYFTKYKIPRLTDWKRNAADVIQDLKTSFHQIDSTTILRFVPELKERMN